MLVPRCITSFPAGWIGTRHPAGRKIHRLKQVLKRLKDYVFELWKLVKNQQWKLCSGLFITGSKKYSFRLVMENQNFHTHAEDVSEICQESTVKAMQCSIYNWSKVIFVPIGYGESEFSHPRKGRDRSKNVCVGGHFWKRCNPRISKANTA